MNPFKDPIKAVEDVEKIQEIIKQIHEWDTKKLNHFKISKLQVFLDGLFKGLKHKTLCFTGPMEEFIRPFSSLRDFGVTVSGDAKLSLTWPK